MAVKNTSNQYTGISYYLRTVLTNPYSITVAIILSFFIGFSIPSLAPFGFLHVANKIETDLTKADSIRDTTINSHQKKKVSTNERALINQYNYIGAMKREYLDVATQFEVFYYAFITTLVIATVATTILITVISRKGWDSQSPNLQAAFYGFFFCASTSAIFISAFNYSQNSTNNINKYFYLTNLQTNIYEVLSIEPYADPKKPSITRDTTLINVFMANNKNLKENSNLFLDIKAESIPSTPDITKITSGQKATGQTTNK